MMPRQDPRPVNLSLRHFRFPPNAILSISHRVTGVLLVATLLGWLVWLNLVMFEPSRLPSHQAWLLSGAGKVFLSLFWLALAFHWLAGLRHLLIEFCLNKRLTAFIRSESAVWLLLGLWFTLSLFALLRIW
ncbi:succinate dehydrogenase, cytochrome b556 subunit [Thiomicrospira microaerophila]|uniref:succinate dehydrogenase, cytochrome b556 subunit n=1 Tax=Thiomicrospira microaerophila TaxID=406020 RepID=UPI00069677CE|nr:succinate dehydrogenase, cytochrome b556 subunit [Thiomicrospira microaerophila]